MNTKTTFKFLVVLCWAVTGSAGWCVRSRFAWSAHEHGAMYKVADLKLGICLLCQGVSWDQLWPPRRPQCIALLTHKHTADTHSTAAQHLGLLLSSSRQSGHQRKIVFIDTHWGNYTMTPLPPTNELMRSSRGSDDSLLRWNDRCADY